MTKAKISQYDAVAGNNTDVNGVNIAEGCPPSSMNNMGREIMAALKRYQVGSDGDGVTVGGNLVVSGTATVTSGSINGTTVGATTPATGSFTTLNTSGQVVFNDAGANVDFRVEGDTDANLLFVDASADKVGIGATDPAAKLDVRGIFAISNSQASYWGIDRDDSTGSLTFSDSNTTPKLVLDTSGNVGIGTTSPATKFEVRGGAITAGAATVVLIGRNSSGFPTPGDGYFRLRTNNLDSDNGGISIDRLVSGVFTESMSIDSAGTVRFNAYGAGTLSTSASGVISASDARYKTKTREVTSGLEAISALQPTYFRWNEDSPFASEYEELGFVAQEVAAVIPEASPGEDEEGKYRNYHDRAIIAMLVKGMQEQQALITALTARVAALESN